MAYILQIFNCIFLENFCTLIDKVDLTFVSCDPTNTKSRVSCQKGPIYHA